MFLILGSKYLKFIRILLFPSLGYLIFSKILSVLGIKYLKFSPILLIPSLEYLKSIGIPLI